MVLDMDGPPMWIFTVMVPATLSSRCGIAFPDLLTTKNFWSSWTIRWSIWNLHFSTLNVSARWIGRSHLVLSGSFTPSPSTQPDKSKLSLFSAQNMVLIENCSGRKPICNLTLSGSPKTTFVFVTLYQRWRSIAVKVHHLRQHLWVHPFFLSWSRVMWTTTSTGILRP